MAYGISNVVGAIFGGLPTATYSQNVGIVASTKVVARKVFRIAAVILLVAGLVPVFSAVLTTIPYCVLGGATISVFASITMTGIQADHNSAIGFPQYNNCRSGNCPWYGCDTGECSISNIPSLGNNYFW